MATVKKRSGKVADRQEVSATDLLNNFTHASRSINGIDGSSFSKKSGLSAKQDYYKEMVGELQTHVRTASRKSELSVKERIELERKGEEEARKLSGMPSDKLKESFSGFVKKIKGSAYDDAVSRVAKLTEDLQRLASADSKAASYALETAIHDLSSPAVNRSAGKSKESKKEEEPQIAKDLKLIRKVAIIEELSRNLVDYAKSVNPIGKTPVLREDSPFRRILYPEEKAGKTSTGNEHAAEKAEAAPETKAEEVNERHGSANEKHGNGQEGGAERSRSSQHKREEEQALILDIGKLDTPEKIMKQRSIIDANIHKRVDEIDRLLYNMSGKEKANITTGELEKVSDANIKLFVEIGAYRDLLMEMKDNLGRTFPDVIKISLDVPYFIHEHRHSADIKLFLFSKLGYPLVRMGSCISNLLHKRIY